VRCTYILTLKEERDTDRACRISTPSRRTRTWRSRSGERGRSSSCTGRTFFHPRRHGYCCVRSAGLGASPFPASLPSTDSRLTRRDPHPHLRAKALSRCPRLHPCRHVRPARRSHPPTVHHHARQPRDAAKAAGALSALFHSTGIAVGMRAPPMRVPALSGTVFGLAALRTDPQFEAGVMYDILALTLVQRRL
jgi:hypothetical protein